MEQAGSGIGWVRMEVVEDSSASSLIPFVLDNAAPNSVIHTDAWSGYATLHNHRQHKVFNVAASASPAHISLPLVHRIASLFKRWVLGTHQGGISKEQLDWYLAEFVFRFNRRRSRNRGLLFLRLIERAPATSPQPYATITAP